MTSSLTAGVDLDHLAEIMFARSLYHEGPFSPFPYCTPLGRRLLSAALTSGWGSRFHLPEGSIYINSGEIPCRGFVPMCVFITIWTRGYLLHTVGHNSVHYLLSLIHI